MPAEGSPCLLVLLDPRDPEAPEILRSLLVLRREFRGRLQVLALADTDAAGLGGLGVGGSLARELWPEPGEARGLTYLAVPGIAGRLGLAAPASLLLGAGGFPLAARTGPQDWAGAEIRGLLEYVLSALPSAPPGPESYLSDRELALLEEVNLVRSGPPRYAAYLDGYEFHLRGRTLAYAGRPAVALAEGFSAAEEARAYLASRRALPPLGASGALTRATRAPSGDGADLLLRLGAQGSWQGTVAEVRYRGFLSGRDLVLALLVDDGKPGRPDRLALLNPDLRLAGLSIRDLGAGEIEVVIDLAWGFASTP